MSKAPRDSTLASHKSCMHLHVIEGQIRYALNDNFKIVLSVLHENICCECSLESPRLGFYNEQLNIGF